MNDELKPKPCPFCGGPTTQEVVNDEHGRLFTRVRAVESARVSELEAQLAEAREAIRDAADQTGGSAACDDERLRYEEIQVDRGWRKEWRALPAVRAALAERSEG